MQDILTLLSGLRRPRLLIRAARIAAEDYRRDRHLGRVLYGASDTRPGAAIMRLMELESDLNDQRMLHDAAYSVTRHVEVLSAMMGEARLLREAR